MQPTPLQYRPAQQRRGFSLVEILIVLSILLLLMGIAYVALGRSGDQARIAATRTTLAQLDTALRAEYQAMLQDFTEQERKKLKKAEWGNLAAGREILRSGGPPLSAESDARLDVIVKLNRYIGLFPQRFDDLFGLDGIQQPEVGPAWGTVNVFGAGVAEDAWNSRSPTYRRIVAGAGRLQPARSSGDVLTAMTTAGAQNVNAELLYLLLTGGENGSQLLDQINPRHIGDTDSDGYPEFLDDWGQPIRFYNTPTALFYAGASSSVQKALFPSQQPGNKFPFDPANSLLMPTPSTNLLVGTAPDTYVTAAGVVYCHAATYFAPLLVSCGPDQALGLIEPDAAGGPDRTQLLAVPSSPDETFDNLTNYQGAN
jgi:prepilin-type N-terminal cleavage/methylation domain-containing protein